ncbi:MAG TPA: hypothetical protein VM692_11310 [Gammaproteobacteria bacterium]|nr:hypothetical protein [Gammaproteobacteria bacterium]
MKHIRTPDGVCLQCFNSQQRFAFPFLVYCEHSESLALVRSAEESTTFHCKPAQLAGVLKKISSVRGGADAIPPARDRL